MARVALVTGGARGIGLAIARDLARDHDVAATWLSSPPDALPDTVLPIRADLRERDACEAVVAQVMDRFGRIDVIVNNAGVVTASGLEDFDAQAASDMFSINLIAAQTLLAAALPHLRPGSAIVNISSANAEFPPMGAALYGASKAALNLWTRGMAKELGPKQIRVNAVAPGAVHIADEPRPDDLVEAFTALTALGRLATPRDVARALRFLASEEASCITGEVLTVSGGYRL